MASATAAWKRADTAAVGVPPREIIDATARTVAPRVEHPVVPHRHRVGLGRLAVGDRLELDRGLALVVDPRADAAQRGHGVEQPPHARGLGRGQPGPGQLGDRPPARRRHLSRERRRQRGLLLPGRHEPGAGHAPRLADRLLAAGHAHGAAGDRRARTRRGRRPAARRPTPCRPCRTRCRRRSRRRPGPPRRARPGRRPGARGGAGRPRVEPHRARSRTSSRGTRGAGRGPRRAGSTANSRSKCSMPSVNERSVSHVFRSPM